MTTRSPRRLRSLALALILAACTTDQDRAGTVEGELQNHLGAAGVTDDGSIQTRTILAIVNDRSLSEDDYVFKVKLSRSTAAAIIATRDGANGVMDSRAQSSPPAAPAQIRGLTWRWQIGGDDESFATLRELDALPGTDTDAFVRLKEYAVKASHGWVERPEGVFAQVSAGRDHTCGLSTDRRVTCWGANDRGQSQPGPLGSMVDLSAGSYHTCALLFDGKAYCWGLSTTGATTPPEDSRFEQLSAGAGHTCGLRRDHTVACWGTGGIEGSSVLDVPQGTFTKLASGDNQTCALREDGSVTCWGRPQNLGFDAPLKTLAVGFFVGCGVGADGAATCRTFGQDGDVPTERQPDGLLLDIVPGNAPPLAQTVCGIREDHSVSCFPILANAAPPLADPAGQFRRIAIGERHGCGIAGPTGEMRCWGDNTLGQAPPP